MQSKEHVAGLLEPRSIFLYNTSQIASDSDRIVRHRPHASRPRRIVFRHFTPIIPLLLPVAVLSACAESPSPTASPSRKTAAVARTVHLEGRLVNAGQRRYDQITWLGAHNAFAGKNRYTIPNQNLTIPEQLAAGVRYIDFDVWLVRQRLIGLTLHFEYYLGSDTNTNDPLLKDVPLQAVAAHGSVATGAFVPLHPGLKFQDLEEAYREVNNFLVGQTDPTVVTIGIQSQLHPSNYHYERTARINSGLFAREFKMQGYNSGLPAPAGQILGWNWARYGSPSIEDMAEHGKNVVFLGPHASTVDGDESVNSETWTEVKVFLGRTLDPSKFADYSMFKMPHSRTLPEALQAAFDNSYPTIHDHVSDVVDAHDRIPNIVTFDFVDVGNHLDEGVLGWSTRYLTTTDLDPIWQEELTPRIEVSPEPSDAGWFNRTVEVVRFSSVEGLELQAATATLWLNGEGDAGEARWTFSPEYPSFRYDREGDYLLGFSVIDAKFGRRSTHMLVPIRIDYTPPELTVEAVMDSTWPPNGKPIAVSVTGSASDFLSGLADGSVQYRVIDEYGEYEPSGSSMTDSEGMFTMELELIARRRGGDLDGRTYRIEVIALDKAGNSTIVELTATIPHDRRFHAR